MNLTLPIRELLMQVFWSHRSVVAGLQEMPVAMDEEAGRRRMKT
ncbi:MAG TPA: hypothetical protein VGK99_15910 [Acidobacteriota bacterium]|jgi:hypothetical protein